MSMHGLALHPALRNHRRGAILFLGEGSSRVVGQELLLGSSCLLLLYDSVGSVHFRHTLRDDLVVRPASVYSLVILLPLVVFADNARVQGVRRVGHDVIHLPVLKNFAESESSSDHGFDTSGFSTSDTRRARRWRFLCRDRSARVSGLHAGLRWSWYGTVRVRQEQQVPS